MHLQHHACWHERERIQCSIHRRMMVYTLVKISQYIDICPIFLSESPLYECLNLSADSWGTCYHQPSTSTWPQRTNWRMEAAFCQQVSARKCHIKRLKMNQAEANWLGHNHKKMLVADRLSSCLQTQAWKWSFYYFILFTFFGRNDFIMSVIMSHSLHGHNMSNE